MNKLFDEKFYVLTSVNLRLSKNNKVYLVGEFTNQQNGKVLKLTFFQAPKKKESK